MESTLILSEPCPTASQEEAAAKAKAKEDLKAFLLSNEVNKKVMGGAGCTRLWCAGQGTVFQLLPTRHPSGCPRPCSAATKVEPS